MGGEDFLLSADTKMGTSFVALLLLRELCLHYLPPLSPTRVSQGRDSTNAVGFSFFVAAFSVAYSCEDP